MGNSVRETQSKDETMVVYAIVETARLLLHQLLGYKRTMITQVSKDYREHVSEKLPRVEPEYTCTVALSIDRKSITRQFDWRINNPNLHTT